MESSRNQVRVYVGTGVVPLTAVSPRPIVGPFGHAHWPTANSIQRQIPTDADQWYVFADLKMDRRLIAPKRLSADRCCVGTVRGAGAWQTLAGILSERDHRRTG